MYKIVKFDSSSMKKNLENMRSLHYRAGKIEPGLIPVPGTNLLFQLLPEDQAESKSVKNIRSRRCCMAELSNAVFHSLIEASRQDTDTFSVERHHLTMTDDEWETAKEITMEHTDTETLTELRSDSIEIIRNKLKNSELSHEETVPLKLCIEEIEQASFKALKGLFWRLIRWELESEGTPFIPESQTGHPAGMSPQIRLLDYGGIRVSEDALKLILLERPN